MFCSSKHHWFSTQDNFDKSEIQPLRAPLESLLDVDHLAAWASASDATFHRVRGTAAAGVTTADVAHPDARKP